MISLSGVSKVYSTGVVEVRALHDINLSIAAGEFVAVTGPSGSGKSTLMNIIGCLDKPTTGKYVLAERDVSRMTKDELALMRSGHLGFVFQSFNLLPRMTALRNVEQPLIYAGVSRRERRQLATMALDRVGLAERLYHRPNELSGGQNQRVALARALVNRPKVLLADEPTGNLDSKSSREVMEIFSELNREGVTILVVTHEEEVAAYAKRVIRFMDGEIVSDIWQEVRTR